jgi:hypothetical protein
VRTQRPPPQQLNTVSPTIHINHTQCPECTPGNPTWGRILHYSNTCLAGSHTHNTPTYNTSNITQPTLVPQHSPPLHNHRTDPKIQPTGQSVVNNARGVFYKQHTLRPTFTPPRFARTRAIHTTMITLHHQPTQSQLLHKHFSPVPPYLQNTPT